MTQITFQDGKVLLIDGKVGSGAACCCGRCCGGYANCQVTYTVTLSTGQVINGTGYLPVTESQEVLNAVGGLDFSVVPLTVDGACTLRISWSTEYFCDPVDFDVVGYSAYRNYAISCADCCDKDPADTGYAYNCTLAEMEGGTTQDPPCANGIEQLGDHVTNVTIDSIVCDSADCNPQGSCCGWICDYVAEIIWPEIENPEDIPAIDTPDGWILMPGGVPGIGEYRKAINGEENCSEPPIFFDIKAALEAELDAVVAPLGGHSQVSLDPSISGQGCFAAFEQECLEDYAGTWYATQEECWENCPNPLP